ncbi:MAG: HEAT repeat domain-containing protein [Planctomycetes bacterium]|nr:HEAT repeat domain-containing protein [Planctomycetota bacterium]
MKDNVVFWVVLCVGGILLRLLRRSERGESRESLAKAWMQAAKELGLDFHGGADGSAHGTILGTLDGVDIRITDSSPVSSEPGAGCTRVSIQNPELVPALSIRAKGVASKFGTALGVQEVATGHRSFDKEVHASGPEALVVALLDDAMRRDLRTLILQDGGRVENGTLQAEFQSLFQTSSWIVREVRRLLALAGRLSRPGPIPKRLVSNARTDRLPGVRRRNLELLLTIYAEEPEAAKACREVVEQELDPMMRLRAGRWLKEEGWPALEKLTTEKEAPEQVRLDAFHDLVGALPAAKRTEFLERAVGLPAGAVRTAALGGLLHLHERDLEWLIRHALELDGAAAARAAVALGSRGSERAEPPLISLLLSSEAPVRLAAMAALGEVGTASAVEPLRRAAVEAPLLGGGELRAAAEAAVKRIQGRLGNAAAVGRISLAEAEAEAGALTLAHAEGALSVVDGRAPAEAEDALADAGRKALASWCSESAAEGAAQGAAGGDAEPAAAMRPATPPEPRPEARPPQRE